MAEQVQEQRTHLLIATGVVAAAALLGAWGPPGLVGVLALLALMRICWLEDNISNDLIGRDSLPNAYINTAIRRGNILRLLLGREPAETAKDLPPHHMATAMRAEIQVWACMILGMSSTLVAQRGPFGPVGDLLLGAVLFVFALRRVDRLLFTLAHCAAGQALPQRLLLPMRRRVASDED
jgi:hypothetical protein